MRQNIKAPNKKIQYTINETKGLFLINLVKPKTYTEIISIYCTILL